MMDTTRALPEDVISGAVLENKANPRRKARGPESRAPPAPPRPSARSRLSPLALGVAV